MDRENVEKLKGRGLLPNGRTDIPKAALPEPFEGFVQDSAFEQIDEPARPTGVLPPTGLDFPYDLPEPAPHVTDDWKLHYLNKHAPVLVCPVCSALIGSRAWGSAHLAWHATIAKTIDIPRPLGNARP